MAFSQRVRNDNPASFGVGTAQGQQLNVMAASLLDQNSRSLFHKQRVRAFFSPNFFDAADPALRRLDGWSAEPQRTLGREFLGRFSVLSDVAPDCVPTANYFVPPLNLSLPLLPQIRGPIARYWTIAWFTTHHHAVSAQNHQNPTFEIINHPRTKKDPFSGHELIPFPLT